MEILNNLGIFSSCLLITDELDSNLVFAVRNVPYVTVKSIGEISVYDIMKYNYVLTTPTILERLEGKVS
jgi:ribosomal protein L4